MPSPRTRSSGSAAAGVAMNVGSAKGEAGAAGLFTDAPFGTLGDADGLRGAGLPFDGVVMVMPVVADGGEPWSAMSVRRQPPNR